MTKNNLTPRQKEFRKLRRNRYTMPEIARKYGITKQTVWEILQRIAAKGYEIKPKGLK